MNILELKNIILDNNYEIIKDIKFERIYVNKFLNSFSRYFITFKEINGEAYLTDNGETFNTLTAIEKDYFIKACYKYNLTFTDNIINTKFEDITSLDNIIFALDEICAIGHERYEKALRVLHENYKTTSHGYDMHYIKINKELTFGTFYSLILANHVGEPVVTDWADTIYYLHKLKGKEFFKVCAKYDINFQQGTMERKFISNEDVEIFIKAIDELVEMHENLDE